MKPDDVHKILKSIGADTLHHANTVLTSCTFLEQHGLLSRGFVEDHSLKQTPQESDDLDKKFGIWHRIFLDHVDIHRRAGRVKGPNQYGPVLFVLDIDVLLHLPPGADILVTKSNPVHWSSGQSDSDRYYLTADELSKSIHFGDFDKMLVIKTSSDTLPFGSGTVQILLDNPQKNMQSGEDAYTHAENRLRQAALNGNVNIAISQHECRNDCICVKKYAGYGSAFFDSRFE